MHYTSPGPGRNSRNPARPVAFSMDAHAPTANPWMIRMVRPVTVAALLTLAVFAAAPASAQDCAAEAQAMSRRLAEMPVDGRRREADILTQAAGAFADLDNQDACRRALEEAKHVLEQPRTPPAPVATASQAESPGAPAVSVSKVAPPAATTPAAPVAKLPQATAVYFGVGASALDSEARDTIKPLAERAAADGLGVRLRGFTDSTGSRALNLALSRKRVESVAGAFAKAGVPDARIAKDWEGIDPALPEKSDRSVEKSRRVEIELVR